MGSNSQPQATVCIFGLGYVGCVTAACLASVGHRVIGVDTDKFKVQSVNNGSAPFYEPGLEELVSQGVESGRLKATDSVSEGLKGADIALICVGTPSERNGNLGLGQLRKVSEEIGAELRRSGAALIVAVRSTVFPGTAEEVVIPALAGCKVEVVSNPEFLREGSAVKDFQKPSLIVVGGTDRSAVEGVASLYGTLGIEPCLVSLRTAEMIKYACNAFHAVKIGFANEIGSLASRLGVDPDEVMDTLCQDEVLNISRAYLKPGFAFGGSCLPKDLRALGYRARELDLRLPFLESVLPANVEHLNRGIERILETPARDKIGIFGLAFKENTDDLRESPVVAMVEQLIGKGRDLRIFDPHIRLDLIYGSNQRFLMQAIPHIGKLMDPDFNSMTIWADRLVIAQKPSADMADKLRQTGKPILDLVGAGLESTGNVVGVG